MVYQDVQDCPIEDLILLVEELDHNSGKASKDRAQAGTGMTLEFECPLVDELQSFDIMKNNLYKRF